MRLEQITYFLRVAEHGNITAAAKSLYISQPALSKQITLLNRKSVCRCLNVRHAGWC